MQRDVTPAAIVLEGPLAKLRAEGSDPVRYALAVAGAGVAIDPYIGQGVRVRWLRRIVCATCGGATNRSYGQGHCYACFAGRAACDLCVRSPDRCHYHLGTCREPEWGRANCMREHIVYLAHSSDVKVGITRADQVPVRWLDQGAVAALPVARTASRRAAGHLEAAAKALLPDRTDWRKMVQADPPPHDLRQHAQALRRRLAPALPAIVAAAQGDAIDWIDGEEWSARYPRLEATAPLAQTLDLEAINAFEGVLLGIKGQYLLFDCGAFNVRRHTGFVVTVALGAAVVRRPVQTTMF